MILDRLFKKWEKAALVQEKEGCMEVFKTDEGRSVVAVDRALSEPDALIAANRHFRVKKDRLEIQPACVKNDTLYFGEKRGAKKAWAVMIKKA